MPKPSHEKVLAAVRAEKQRCERAVTALADEMKDLGEPLRFLPYLRRAWDAALAKKKCVAQPPSAVQITAITRDLSRRSRGSRRSSRPQC